MKQYVFRTQRLSCGYLNLFNLFLTSYKNNYGKGYLSQFISMYQQEGIFFYTWDREKKGIEAEILKNSANFLSPKQMK